MSGSIQTTCQLVTSGRPAVGLGDRLLSHRIAAVRQLLNAGARIPCEIIVDDAAEDGVRNMAVDAQLLDDVGLRQNRCVVRIYRWAEPTVTLGYFQDPASVNVPGPLRRCPQVRRLTGGGAILHDQEVTYSCVVPPQHAVRSNPVRLYDIVHSAIVGCLTRAGASACLRRDRPDPDRAVRTDAEPFLCFLRGDERDIVSQGHKVVGSAQRRRRGTILQHGSIVLSASPLLPEIPGLSDLNPEFNLVGFLAELPSAIALGITGQPAPEG